MCGGCLGHMILVGSRWVFGTHDFGGFGGCLGHMILVGSGVVWDTFNMHIHI